MSDFGTILFDAEACIVHMKYCDIDIRRDRTLCGEIIVRTYANTIAVDCAIDLLCDKCFRAYFKFIGSDPRFYKNVSYRSMQHSLRFYGDVGKTNLQYDLNKTRHFWAKLEFIKRFRRKTNKYDTTEAKIRQRKKFRRK
jgi:hypothetical protein